MRRLFRLLLGILLGYALIRRLVGLREGVPLPPVIPIAVTDPDPGGPGGPGGPGEGHQGPDTSAWPAFDEPAYADPGVLPRVPECDTVYTLVYTDAFNWGGATRRDAVRKARQRGPDLLKWARDQARRYCARNPICRGVVEIDHEIQWEVYELDDEDVIELTITYYFRCDTLGAGQTTPPRDQTGRPPYGWGDPTEPECGGEYTFMAHRRTPVAFGCQGADARAAEQAHERDLLADARFHARNFCAAIPNWDCRDVAEVGRHFTHRCAHSRTTGETWVLSTIVYRFDCAMLA